MISSLQQLHTAARQTRNFLSNFQVAFRRRTPGHFGSEVERFTPLEGREESCVV